VVVPEAGRSGELAHSLQEVPEVPKSHLELQVGQVGCLDGGECVDSFQQETSKVERMMVRALGALVLAYLL
jgi:hypothetical protein